MERQKNIAEDNSGREIGYFSSVINVSNGQLLRHIYQFAIFPQDLTCLWQEPEVSEVLHRLARKAEELELKTKKLAAASGNHFFVIMKEDHLKGGVPLFLRFKWLLLLLTQKI